MSKTVPASLETNTVSSPPRKPIRNAVRGEHRSKNSRASVSTRVLKLELDLLRALCENIGSVRSLTVSLLASAGEWTQLLDLKCDPNHYDDHRSFSDDYLVTSVMQKNPRLPTDTDKAAVAIGKFRRAEEVCSETNRRLAGYMYGNIPFPSDVRPSIHYAREIIRSILGPLTRADLQYAESNMRFGPGSTTSVSGVVTQGKKYSRLEIDATPRLASFRAFCFPEYWKQLVKSIRVTPSSKLTTVPKNAKTDRVICIEPDLNIFVQLGTGALIRKKLMHFGLDLDSQERNQNLARDAGKLDLCTMDLSAASDTISREVVWCLLPDRWGELLHYSRVDKTRIGEEIIPLEKWSSMGNGYTFELESLIFLGIVLGCCEAIGCDTSSVSVYGDDLIFPNEARELVERTLTFLGFSVNVEKTFGKGRFHESCGTDWFDGVNVRPFFLRSLHHDFESVCYLYANNARHWARRSNNDGTCDSRLLPFWLRCFRAVEPNERHLIPQGFGDVGFVVDFDFAKPTLSRSLRDRGWGGFTFHYRSVKAERAEISHLGCLTAWLNGNCTTWTRGIESLRGRFSPATREEGYSLEWPNLGPWLNTRV
ncbi:RNA-directed RNA polymerase [ssRNA phage Gerhypos.4_32]|uniref:RNA-directed RNA polymerase n=2 Tax=Fiersviridae TaxID=2842319 RepID=A0A8S5KXC1_9VIRU|nr:RNA-directed RNA polymerase [ssRNA phage Gerhypos.4_32]QDH86907.1 MAG: RNA-dependent RNA polymerase [Leviviridae sp.]DAD50222.1 TPA_asm: RNA-directed RNA polymerase [ssRNA phage Gerhypos.4_32]